MLTSCCFIGDGKAVAVQYAVQCDLGTVEPVYADEAKKPTGIHKVTQPVISFFQGKEEKAHDPRQEVHFDLLASVTEKDFGIKAGKSRARIGYLLRHPRPSPNYHTLVAASMPVAEC